MVLTLFLNDPCPGIRVLFECFLVLWSDMIPACIFSAHSRPRHSDCILLPLQPFICLGPEPLLLMLLLPWPFPAPESFHQLHQLQTLYECESWEVNSWPGTPSWSSLFLSPFTQHLLKCKIRGAVQEWTWAEDTIPERVWCARLPTIICCSYLEDKASVQPQLFCSARGWSHSLMHTRQVLYHWATPVLFLLTFA